MRYSFAIAALVGSAIALPSFGHGHRHVEKKGVQHTHVIVETVVHTVYHTDVYGNAPAPTPAPEPVYQAPAAPLIIVKPTLTREAPAPPPAYTPAPAPAPAADSNEPTYMGCVSEWRKNLGKGNLSYNSTLADNASKTMQKVPGKMEHTLFPGSFAQVMAFGAEKDFEHVFVGGWLCEMPGMPGLNGVCAQQSEGFTYADPKSADPNHPVNQVDHAKIVSDNDYHEIGCAWLEQVWTCDLA